MMRVSAPFPPQLDLRMQSKRCSCKYVADIFSKTWCTFYLHHSVTVVLSVVLGKFERGGQELGYLYKAEVVETKSLEI